MAGGEPLVLRPPGIWGNAAPGLCRAGLSGSETFPSGAVRDALSQGDVCEKIRLVTSTSAGPISKDRSRAHDPLLPCPARSEERRVGQRVSVRVDLGGRRIIKKYIYK